MAYLSAFVDFKCSLPLEEAAAVLSEALFGGVTFGGRDNYVREEVPAVYSLRDVMGLRAVLHGFGGDDGFTLELMPHDYPLARMGETVDRYLDVDISKYIACLIGGIPGMIVTAHPVE